MAFKLFSQRNGFAFVVSHLSSNLSTKAVIPKKPPLPYFLFVKDHLVKGEKLVDQVKEIASKWRVLDAETRKDYEIKAKVLKEDYEAQRALIPPEEYKELLRDQRAEKRKMVLEFMAKIGRPKRPIVSAFITFANERKPEKDSDAEKQLEKNSKDWNALDAAAKAVYEKKAQETFQDYENQLKAWREKLMRDGFPKETPKQIFPKLVYELEQLLQRPKRPLSPYFTFLKERKGQVPGEKWEDRNKRLAEEWNNMDAATKQRYTTQYQEEVKKNRVLVEEWREKLIREGPPKDVCKEALLLFQRPQKKFEGNV